MTEVVRYWSEVGGYVVALKVKEGPKFITVIPMDSAGIRLVKIPVKEAAITPIEYSLKKAKKIFRAAAKKFGVTTGAKPYLRGDE